MVKACSAYGCTNSCKKSGEMGGLGRISFHKFPKDSRMCEKWAAAMGRSDWTPHKNSYVCSDHFKNEDFDLTHANGFRFLKSNVVPSIFVFDSPVVAHQRRSRKRSLLNATPSPSSNDTIRVGDTNSTELVLGGSGVSDTKPPRLHYVSSAISQQFCSSTTVLELMPREKIIVREIHSTTSKLLKCTTKLGRLQEQNRQAKKRCNHLAEVLKNLEQRNLRHKLI